MALQNKQQSGKTKNQLFCFSAFVFQNAGKIGFNQKISCIFTAVNTNLNCENLHYNGNISSMQWQNGTSAAKSRMMLFSMSSSRTGTPIKPFVPVESDPDPVLPLDPTTPGDPVLPLFPEPDDDTAPVGESIHEPINPFSPIRPIEPVQETAGASALYKVLSYNYYTQDHLGNNRVVITESGNVAQVTNYYPFGGVFSTTAYNSGDDLQPYKYNGKELDRTHGLDWYDYGARNYDAFLPMFTSIDPHCEKYYNVSPYAYCHNNSVNLIDPDGKDDYRFEFDKNTGIFYLMKKTDDKTDRVLNYREDKKNPNNFTEKGVIISNIEKGILKHKADYKNNNNIISVGDGGPSVQGVKDFVLKFSELVDREIRGFGYSADGSENISDIVIGGYNNNTKISSTCSFGSLMSKYKEKFTLKNIILDFHTHPDGELGATLYAPELSKDVSSMRALKKYAPNATFLILYKSSFDLEEYDYTDK